VILLSLAEKWLNNADLRLSGTLASEWDCFVKELMGVGVSLFDFNDTLLWTGGDATGKISVKNIYSALISTQDLPKWRGWKVSIWKWKLQLKIKLFYGWRLQIGLLTWDILQKKGWEGPGICILCKLGTEDNNHLFLHCIFTQTVWSRISFY
jgi:hypothetical protein